jgi:tagaturonate reductase
MSTSLPETVLQFGSGRFLRAFADLFIQQANQQGQKVGRVVIVQSTAGDRAGALASASGKYHVVIRGIENGQVVDRVEACESVSRALAAQTQWPQVLELARSPHLATVLSNTTEAGYETFADEKADDAVPRSFPAKLLAVLKVRHEAGLPGLRIIPCELREGNAGLLKQIVLDLAARFGVDQATVDYIQNTCSWHETLVDRIVTGTPAEHPLLATDPLLTVCEPYALFAIHRAGREKPGQEFLKNPAIIWTDDVLPYFLRKVRILNGGHTALLLKAWPRGFRQVGEAVKDAENRAWLDQLLFTEIVPVLEGRCDDPAGFAKAVLDRFANPFLQHKLADIALHHASKVQVRLVPTLAEYEKKFGKKPPLLSALLADGGALPADLKA